MGFALRSFAPARERSRAMFPSDRAHMPFPERPLPDVRFFCRVDQPSVESRTHSTNGTVDPRALTAAPGIYSWASRATEERVASLVGRYCLGFKCSFRFVGHMRDVVRTASLFCEVHDSPTPASRSRSSRLRPLSAHELHVTRGMSGWTRGTKQLPRHVLPPSALQRIARLTPTPIRSV